MDRRIHAGNLNQKIIIQKRTVEYVKGIKQDNWHEDKPYYGCSAELIDLYGTEKNTSFNTTTENTIKFRCRWCNLLDNLILENVKDYRIIYKGKALSLVFVDSCNGSKTEIILQCKKFG